MVSFFEKITGTVPVEKAKEAPIAAAEPETIEVTEAPHEEEEMEIELTASKGAVAERHKKDDWSALQAEGQLTVDIFEKGDKIVIQSAVAGTDPDDLDITLTHDMITIKGTRKHSEEISEDTYFYRELYWGSFSRSIILPEEVDESKAEASIRNGILTIKLPKKTRGNQKLKVRQE